MANKYLIYTVCTNDYDQVKPPKVYSGFDYWLFTDNPALQVRGWKSILIEKSEGCKRQREIKIRSCEYTKGYSITIYHDANIELTNNPLQLVRQIFKGGMLTCTHHSRINVLQEADKIVELGKDTRDSCERTLEAVKDCPINFGLWATGIIVRDKSVKELEETWWDMVKNYSHRDQLTLPYASWKTKTDVVGLRKALLYSFFKLTPHQSKKSDKIRIWYSNPYRSDKNIGGAYNDFIRSLKAQDDDWIVLQDGDILYLTPDWGQRIEEALTSQGEGYGLVGCYTNRIKGTHQQHGGRMSEDFNIKSHYDIALTYNKSGIEEIKHGVAGFFMAFQYKTWKAVGGFTENNIACDTIFNSKVREKGFKIGLIRSLYVFHVYRMWAEKEPWNERKHLK